MSDEPLEPWNDSLLRAERARPGPSADVEARMLRRLQAALAPPGAPPAPASAPRPWHASTAARVASYVATLGLGITLGTQLPRAPSVPAPTVATVDASAPAIDASAVPVALPEGPDASADAPPAATDATSRTTARDAARRAPAPEDGDLTAETALLDQAHAALARGDASGALSATATHAHRFPRGQLAAYRESLAVQCLVQLGRADEARSRAASFVRRWPDALQRHEVERALRSLSETSSDGAPQQR